MLCIYVWIDIPIIFGLIGTIQSGRTLLSLGGTVCDDNASGSSPKIVGLTTEVIDFACFKQCDLKVFHIKN